MQNTYNCQLHYISEDYGKTIPNYSLHAHGTHYQIARKIYSRILLTKGQGGCAAVIDKITLRIYTDTVQTTVIIISLSLSHSLYLSLSRSRLSIAVITNKNRRACVARQQLSHVHTKKAPIRTHLVCETRGKSYLTLCIYTVLSLTLFSL
eukprot:sb/3473565/